MFPKRGAFAVFITVVALVALLAYKTPELSTPGDPAAYFDVPADQSALIAVAGTPTGPDASPASPDAASTWVDAWATGGLPPAAGPTATPGQPPAPGSTPRPVSGATLPPTTQPRTQPPTAKPPTAPPTAAPPKPTPAPGFTGTIDGTVVNMKYGPVQVRVVFSNGKITDVQALQTPTGDSHSVSIAQHAVPILRSEALAAQSASISSVSGATYTSDAFKTSLQSAISKA